jgi:alpha-1,3-rhamnosyl/mannosyltransferase
VVAGKSGWLSDDIDSLVADSTNRGFVKFLGYVPLEDMPALYSAAELFLFVPVYEGFGMPVREALSCGTPVIASDIDSTREAADGLAQLVAPDESSIERMLRDYATGVRKPPRPRTDDKRQSRRTAEMFAEILERMARKR